MAGCKLYKPSLVSKRSHHKTMKEVETGTGNWEQRGTRQCETVQGHSCLLAVTEPQSQSLSERCLMLQMNFI